MRNGCIKWLYCFFKATICPTFTVASSHQNTEDFARVRIRQSLQLKIAKTFRLLSRTVACVGDIAFCIWELYKFIPIGSDERPRDIPHIDICISVQCASIFSIIVCNHNLPNLSYRPGGVQVDMHIRNKS